MKRLSQNSLRRLLCLIAALALLTACFAGCAKKDPTDETVDDLDKLGTNASDPADGTEAPTTPPAETNPVPATVWGTVNTDNLNLRTSTSIESDIVRQLAVDTRVEILEFKTEGDVTWGRIEDGWVNMAYVTLDGAEPVEPTEPPVPEETTEPTAPPANTDQPAGGSGTAGTVTAGELNIRKGAGTDYDVVGKYKKGDKVEILETKGNWGRTDKGWVSMKYINTGSNSGTSSTNATGKTGTINTGALHIRKGAGSSYESIGKYYKGDKVEILESKNGWGRTDKGWISLKYVTLDGSTGTSASTSSEVVTDSNTSALGYGVVTISALNVRTGPGTNYDKTDSAYAGERCAYYQKSGNWVRIKEGWVSTKYFYIEGTKGENAGSGTVTGDSVNVRTGPGTGFKSNGKVNTGDKVEILTQVTVGKMTWGYTKDGWISMDYVKLG